MIQAVLERDELHWHLLSVDRLQKQRDCSLVREFVAKVQSGRLKKGGQHRCSREKKKKLSRRFLDVTLLIRTQSCGHT